jgi:hypothetical protein
MSSLNNNIATNHRMPPTSKNPSEEASNPTSTTALEQNLPLTKNFRKEIQAHKPKNENSTLDKRLTSSSPIHSEIGSLLSLNFKDIIEKRKQKPGVVVGQITMSKELPPPNSSVKNPTIDIGKNKYINERKREAPKGYFLSKEVDLQVRQKAPTETFNMNDPHNQERNPAGRKHTPQLTQQQHKFNELNEPSPPPFKVKEGKNIKKMDISTFFDEFIPFVLENRIEFANEAAAMGYLKKSCEYRPFWLLGKELPQILKLLTGQLQRQIVMDKEDLLLKFLIIEENQATRDYPYRNLSDKLAFEKMSMLLQNKNPPAFRKLLNFLKNNPQVIAYMNSIIHVETGHFPRKGATQNRALFLYGETCLGKTSLARIITEFLVTLKITWTKDKYVPAFGPNGVMNRPFGYNVLQIEELASHSGNDCKNWHQLMQLIDSGTSPIKYVDSTEWGSDSEKDPYHFPVVITSNQTPLEYAEASKMTSTQRNALLQRFIPVRMTQDTEPPNLTDENNFGISRVHLAKYIWAFVFHQGGGKNLAFSFDFGGEVFIKKKKQVESFKFQNIDVDEQLILELYSLPNSTTTTAAVANNTPKMKFPILQNHEIDVDDSISQVQQQQQHDQEKNWGDLGDSIQKRIKTQENASIISKKTTSSIAGQNSLKLALDEFIDDTRKLNKCSVTEFHHLLMKWLQKHERFSQLSDLWQGIPSFVFGRFLTQCENPRLQKLRMMNSIMYFIA